MRKLALAIIAVAIPYQANRSWKRLPRLHFVRQERPDAGRPDPLATAKT